MPEIYTMGMLKFACELTGVTFNELNQKMPGVFFPLIMMQENNHLIIPSHIIDMIASKDCPVFKMITKGLKSIHTVKMNSKSSNAKASSK